MLQKYDDEVANDLFWEKLHHQDDVYPATFAALPYVWSLSEEQNHHNLDILVFLSHVCYCAVRERGTGCDGEGARGKYVGLSTEVADHRHNWLTQNEHLTKADMKILSKLESWFTRNSEEVSAVCIDAVSGENGTDAILSHGFAAQRSGMSTMMALEKWAGDESLDYIANFLPLPDTQEKLAAQAIWKATYDKNPQMAEFLADWAGFDIPDSRQDRFGFDC